MTPPPVARLTRQDMVDGVARAMFEADENELPSYARQQWDGLLTQRKREYLRRGDTAVQFMESVAHERGEKWLGPTPTPSMSDHAFMKP